MRTFGSFLASALLVVAVGCGSDSSGSKVDGSPVVHPDGAVQPDAPVVQSDVPVVQPDGGVVQPDGALPVVEADGGAVQADGAVAPTGVDSGTANGIDSGAAMGTCTMPACMVSSAGDCVPSGACIKQSEGTTTSYCYANGVKMIQQTAAAINITFKNAGAVCYSMAADLASILAVAQGLPLSIPVTNAAGATVASLSYDPKTQQTTVTCPGAAPVALDSSCTGALSFSPTGAPNNCTQGTCAP